MDSIEGVWFPDGGMHAMPVALATAAEKAGTQFRYGASVSEVLRRTDTGRGRRRTTRFRRAAGGRRGRLHPRPADRVREAAARPEPAAGAAPAALLALGRGLARRGSWSAGPGGLAPQHPLRSRVGRRLRRPAQARHPDGRRLAAGHHPVAGRPDAWPRRAARRCSSSSRSPTSPTGRIDWVRRARSDAGAAARPSWPPRATPPTS